VKAGGVKPSSDRVAPDEVGRERQVRGESVDTQRLADTQQAADRPEADVLEQAQVVDEEQIVDRSSGHEMVDEADWLDQTISEPFEEDRP
jgi:hypothetical protein